VEAPPTSFLYNKTKYVFFIWLINKGGILSDDGQNADLIITVQGGTILEASSNLFNSIITNVENTIVTFSSSGTFKKNTAKVAIVEIETSEAETCSFETFASVEDADEYYISTASKFISYEVYDLEDDSLISLLSLADSRKEVTDKFRYFYAYFINSGNPYQVIDRDELSESIRSSIDQTSLILKVAELFLSYLESPSAALFMAYTETMKNVFGIEDLTSIFDLFDLLTEKIDRILDYHHPLIKMTDRTLVQISMFLYFDLKPGYLDLYMTLLEEEKLNWASSNYGQVLTVLNCENEVLIKGLDFVILDVDKAQENEDYLAEMIFSALKSYIEGELSAISNLKNIAQNLASEPDFLLDSSYSLSFFAGEGAELTINAMPIGEFDSNIELSLSINPEVDITGSFSASTIPPGSSSILTLNAGPLVSGEYDIIITGISNGMERSLNVELYVELLNITIMEPEMGSEIQGTHLVQAILDVVDPANQGTLSSMHYSFDDGDWTQMSTILNEGSAYFDSTQLSNGLHRLNVKCYTTEGLSWTKSIYVKIMNPFELPASATKNTNPLQCFITEAGIQKTTQQFPLHTIEATRETNSNQFIYLIMNDQTSKQTNQKYLHLILQQEEINSNIIVTYVTEQEEITSSNFVNILEVPEESLINSNQIIIQELPTTIKIDTNNPEVNISSNIYEKKLDIITGWNLIGVPLKLTEPTIEDIFGANITYVDAIYGYADGVWTYWFPVSSTLDEFECGRGYWVLANDDFTTTLTGTPGDAPPLVEDWNLVGVNSTEPVLTADYLAGAPWSVVYGYDAQTETWSYYINGVGGPLDTLKPGKGYWVLIETE